MGKDTSGRTGLCIVGCGSFATLHAERINRRRERVDLFFASRSKEKAEEYAARFGGTAAFGSYAEAAQDPRVHGLVFCTPHGLHPENAAMAAAHGKHVLLEKPIATTLEEARSLIDTAESAGIRLMVAENFRYLPTVAAALELLRSGAIGNVRSMQADWLVHRRPPGWRQSREMMGGGILIDAGIHVIAAVRALCGDVHRIHAVSPTSKLVPEMYGEEEVSLLLEFRSGAAGTVLCSWNAADEPHTPSCLLLGDAGYIEFPFYGPSVEVSSRGARSTLRALGDHRGMEQQLDAFLDLIEHGRKPLGTPEEGMADLAVVLAAYASMESGRPEEITAEAQGTQRRGAQ